MIDLSLLEELRQTSLIAAGKAGEIIRENYDKPRTVQQKGIRDLVTDTDHAAQDAVFSVIRERHPDHIILSEEDPDSQPNSKGRYPISDGIVWIIDPLDGTSNFIYHVPFVCFSIGVLIDREPVVGVVFDPLRKDCFIGIKGQGTTFNDRLLPQLEPSPLSKSVIGLDWAHRTSTRNQTVEIAGALMSRCHTVRALGSAALGMSYVACGWLQLYFNLGLKPWDTAAAAVIVREVGGELHGYNGDRAGVDEPSIFAGHPAVFEEMQPILPGR
jgi:fructose-1,6-bisphosphatase/inositol monophosphatase family enzyme